MALPPSPLKAPPPLKFTVAEDWSAPVACHDQASGVLCRIPDDGAVAQVGAVNAAGRGICEDRRDVERDANGEGGRRPHSQCWCRRR